MRTYQLFSLPNVADQIALFSQYLGLAALILMAWGQVLATRLPGTEAVFGGLDRIYVLHKWAGIVAMVAVLLHDTIDAEMDGLGRETALNELAETLGELSLYGLLILVVISVATFIPYHLWKWTHKGMGALFAAATFHFFFIMKPFAMTDPAGLYTGLFCLAGLAAYFWTLLPDRIRPSYGYTVANLEKTGGALAITMEPAKKGLKAAAGQFGVLRFKGHGSDEPHPFSFSKINDDGSLRVTTKALGDFTTRLEGHVSERIFEKMEETFQYANHLPPTNEILDHVLIYVFDGRDRSTKFHAHLWKPSIGPDLLPFEYFDANDPNPYLPYVMDALWRQGTAAKVSTVVEQAFANVRKAKAKWLPQYLTLEAHRLFLRDTLIRLRHTDPLIYFTPSNRSNRSHMDRASKVEHLGIYDRNPTWNLLHTDPPFVPN